MEACQDRRAAHNWEWKGRMCELFAMSSRYPVDVNFSMEEFAWHGGGSGPHKDGWGVAYYEDKDAQVFREADSSAHSELLRFVMRHDFRSTIVVSHIRRATAGSVKLANTQPFHRELMGRTHVFAHNGDIQDFPRASPIASQQFHPLGATDSEHAFCVLLNRMEACWTCPGTSPPWQIRREVVERFAHQISRFGPANFIYSDGEFVFAHGHKRLHETGEIGPPGLYMLSRTCEYDLPVLDTQGLRISSAEDCQQVSLFASVPLTEERWIPLKEGEIITATNGLIAQTGTHFSSLFETQGGVRSSSNAKPPPHMGGIESHDLNR